MKLICDNCGEIGHVLVDGYGFGDRLLEGVMFKVRDVNGKPKVDGVTEDSQEYFNGLNAKKWIKECEKYCKELDIATCPNCDEDVPVWDAVSDSDKANLTLIGTRKPNLILNKPLEDITPDEAKSVLDSIFDGCPTIDEVPDALPFYNMDEGFKEAIDTLKKEKGKKEINE